MLDGLKAALSGPPGPTTQHLKFLILSKTQIQRTTSRQATSTLQGSLLVGIASARALLQRGAAVATFTAGPVIAIASETWSVQTVNQEDVHAHVHGHGCVVSAQQTHPGRHSSDVQAVKSCIARTGAHTSRAVQFAIGQGYVTTALKRKLLKRFSFNSRVHDSLRSAGYAVAISAMTAYPVYRGAPVVVIATAIDVDGLRQRIHAKLALPPCAGIVHEIGMIAGSALMQSIQGQSLKHEVDDHRADLRYSYKGHRASSLVVSPPSY